MIGAYQNCILAFKGHKKFKRPNSKFQKEIKFQDDWIKNIGEDRF